MSQSDFSPPTSDLYITAAMRVDRDDWRQVLLSHLANPGTEMNATRGVGMLTNLVRSIHDRLKSIPQFQWTSRFPDLFTLLDRMPDSALLMRVFLVTAAPWSQPEYASLFSKPVSLETNVPEALDDWLESISESTPLLFWLMFNWTSKEGESFELSLQNSLNKLGSSSQGLARILYGNDNASVAKGIRKDIPDYCVRDEGSVFSGLLQLLLESKRPNVRFRFQESLVREFPYAFWPAQLRAEIFPPVKLSTDIHREVKVRVPYGGGGRHGVTLGELAKIACFPLIAPEKAPGGTDKPQ